MIEQYDVKIDELLNEPQNREIYDRIRENYLYNLLRRDFDYSITEDSLIELTKKDAVIPQEYIGLKSKKQYNNIDKIVNNLFLRFYLCKIHFNVSYDEFNFIYETDIDGIVFEDEELEKYIKNIKDIQKGYFSIYSTKQEDIEEKLLNLFEKDMKKNLVNCNQLSNVKVEELNSFGLNKTDVEILDSGLNFCFLIKDMGYAGRPMSADTTYKEYYNVDESHFLYDSKSLVNNSIFTSIMTSQKSLSGKHWMVGYNTIYKLKDASSCDLANKTMPDGSLNTIVKIGKNVKHLCCTKKLLYTTGSLKSNNEVRYKYNEVIDSKYNDQNYKIQPDYIIFAVSSNKNSIFSNEIQERYQTACQAAKDFDIPIVFVNLDKIIKNEFNVVCDKISNYKKTNNIQLLEEIFQQIRMNRTTDYDLYYSNDSYKLFSDQFISNVVIELYDSKQKDLFYQYLDNMPNFNVEKFKSILQMKLNQCNNLLENSNYKNIFASHTIEEINKYLTEEEKQKLSKLDYLINQNERKFFQTKKRRLTIESLKQEKLQAKVEMIDRVKTDSLKEIFNLGMHINKSELESGNFENCINNAISHYESIISSFEFSEKNYSDVPDKIEINYELIDTPLKQDELQQSQQIQSDIEQEVTVEQLLEMGQPVNEAIDKTNEETFDGVKR